MCTLFHKKIHILNPIFWGLKINQYVKSQFFFFSRTNMLKIDALGTNVCIIFLLEGLMCLM